MIAYTIFLGGVPYDTYIEPRGPYIRETRSLRFRVFGFASGFLRLVFLPVKLRAYLGFWPKVGNLAPSWDKPPEMPRFRRQVEFLGLALPLNL